MMIFLKFKIGVLLFLSCFFVQAFDLDYDEKLWDAIDAEDSELVKKYLEEGADPNDIVPIWEVSPLHRVPNAEMTTILLNAGADPNARDALRNTPLHHVRDKEIATILLKAGADPYAKNLMGYTPVDLNPKVREALREIEEDKVILIPATPSSPRKRI